MKPRVITFHYTLQNSAGQTLDSSAGGKPLSFLEGVGQIVPGLETVLTSMKVGDKKRVFVPAKSGYGPRQAEAVIQVPRAKLPTKQIKVGDKFQAANHPAPLVVTAVTATHVTLDANHPLAGVDLTFDVEITDLRPATEQELAGAHQCCGHHMQGGCGEHSH
jgi:FKBP-type peptidyl-prolyl cis-trans isomerase SlyD